MKKVLLGGALAFTLFGGVALANDEVKQDCVRSGDMEAMSPDCQGDINASDPALDNDDAYGGSATEGQTNVFVEPQADQQPAYTSTDQWQAKDDEKVTKDDDLRGVSVTLGGGVEGYTGDLAPQINPGPTWGVGVGLRPTKNLGVELGYSGAVNSIDTAGSQNITSGDSDIVRNGGSAVATVGLSSAAVQPYVLGGIGVDRYNVRHNDTGRFRDDTVGNVPLGLGLRTQVSNFTADLRGTYGILFNQGFAPGEGSTHLGDIGSQTPTGRLGAQLRLGSTF